MSKEQKALFSYHVNQTELELIFQGRFVCFQDSSSLSRVIEIVQKGQIKRVVVQTKEVIGWDSSLAIILYRVKKETERAHIPIIWKERTNGLKRLVELAFSVDRKPPVLSKKTSSFLEKIGETGFLVYQSCCAGFSFLKKVMFSLGRLLSGRAVIRKVDFLFALEDAGYKAVPIVSLISFMVGLILAFVGAVQLKVFGAHIYVASLVTIGMTRIMGAIMIGVIMAGRTGASYAAAIGTMQVNEEIDALKTMGVSISDFLVLPRVLALTLTMPFLTVLADFMGMIGGGAVGVFMLGISPQEYWKLSIEALSLSHFLVGVFHGLVFGIVIALCGCYYGVHSGRDANSVGVSTTKAVVSAIVWMIVMTGLITFACEVIGV